MALTPRQVQQRLDQGWTQYARPGEEIGGSEAADEARAMRRVDPDDRGPLPREVRRGQRRA